MEQVAILARVSKLDILGSIFSGKIVFEKNEPRTAELTPLISIFFRSEATKPLPRGRGFGGGVTW